MQQNRRRIAILFFTMVVIMMGFGLIIPIIPFYIENLGASGTTLGLLMATFALMQFLFAPLWGQLSDRHGRKVILMVGVLGNAISQLFFGLSTQLWMLFASRALAGILSSATLPTAMAYISDTTNEEERGSGMGIIGAAQGVGMVLGPGLAGWLAGLPLSLPLPGRQNLSVSPLPFFVAAALSLVALVLVLAILPESLPTQARNQPQAGLQGPQIAEMWRALFGPLGFLLFLAFLVSFGLTNFEGVFGLYALERYGYGPERVGTILTVIGLTSAVIQGALTGPLTRRWGESAVIRVSLFGTAAGFLLMLQPKTFVGVLLAVSFFVTNNALLRPGISTLISKQAEGGQGMAMGLNNSFMSLGRIVGPAWAGFVLDVNLSFPYVTGAAIIVLGFGLSMIWLKSRQAQTADGRYPAGEPDSLP
jgi:DHA1 family multidrug resistance protein-like MFS transporter